MNLSICIMCKDEPEYLLDNIEYHSLIGVDHFIVYDNKSKIPLKEVLSDKTNVTVNFWDDTDNGSHVRCFNHCIRNYKDDFEWIAFIDVDEFIVMKDGNIDLKKFLEPYKDYGGLGINWLMFGSCGHKNKKADVINNYLYPAFNDTADSCIKTIVNTKFVSTNPPPTNNNHYFLYEEGKFCVNENFEKIDRYKNFPITRDRIQLNHYYTKSLEDWKEKMSRGQSNRQGRSIIDEEKGWDLFQDMTEKDYSIINLIEKVNK